MQNYYKVGLVLEEQEGNMELVKDLGWPISH